jgi:predicted small secreted protein
MLLFMYIFRVTENNNHGKRKLFKQNGRSIYIMKKLTILAVCILSSLTLASCGGNNKATATQEPTNEPVATASTTNDANGTVTDDMGNMADDAGNMVDDAGNIVQDAGDAVGDAAQDMGDAVKDMTQ